VWDVVSAGAWVIEGFAVRSVVGSVLFSGSDLPISVAEVGSLACAIVLIRWWVRMLVLHAILEVSGRNRVGNLLHDCKSYVRSAFCPTWLLQRVGLDGAPGSVRVCAQRALYCCFQVICPRVPTELCSVILHETELSSASSQCWLSLSGMNDIPDSQGIRAEQGYCASGELGSEDHSGIASSMAPKEMWLFP
jgi:hypothetical protein